MSTPTYTPDGMRIITDEELCSIPYEIPARWRDDPESTSPCTLENSYLQPCPKCGAEVWYPKATNPEPPPADRLCFSCEDRCE